MWWPVIVAGIRCKHTADHSAQMVDPSSFPPVDGMATGIVSSLSARLPHSREVLSLSKILFIYLFIEL